MNISLIIGWVISFGLVIFGIFFDNGEIKPANMGNFIEISSLAITVGGTIGCLVASFPMSYLKGLGKRFMLSIKPKKYDPTKYIENIVEYAQVARTRGLLALEESANQCTDPFMKSSLMLIVDANDPEKVRGMLDDTIMFMCERHENGRSFFEKGVSIFPAFGMLGTLIGLINMLASMDFDHPERLTGGMAQALITTFYGSLFANVIMAPIGMALKNAHEDELLCMQIIEEGVLAIAGGSNPRYIQEKLEFMLPKSQHTADKRG
ncbi:MAG: MotA/TolQ/ExbB proton channel family protein [Oscillospiraceae bacterium]|nr:MotA/TolQ/ExbB proton channel family protein [Oscillospiraceae bacterium]